MRNLGTINKDRETTVLEKLRKDFPKAKFRTEGANSPNKLAVILEKDTLEVGGEGEVERMVSTITYSKTARQEAKPAEAKPAERQPAERQPKNVVQPVKV